MVEDILDNLKKENEELLKKNKILQSEKENAINFALNKVKEIEEEEMNVSSQKARELEGIIKDWNELIDSLFVKYPFIKNISSFCENVEKFSINVNNVLKGTISGKKNLLNIGTTNDPMRMLLSKVSIVKKEEKNFKNDNEYRSEKTSIQAANNDEAADKKNYIKPIIQDIQLNKNEKFDCLVDKFLGTPLNNNITATMAKDKKLCETGFDLKEAVNPKDDLNEIMKAFDFFNGEALN